MRPLLQKITKSLRYRASDIAYAVLPRRQVIKAYGYFTYTLNAITWRLMGRYYGSGGVLYRGGVVDFVLSHVQEGERVLDIGCAEGYLTLPISKKAGAVVGIDIEQRYIDSIDTRDFCNTTFIRGDALTAHFDGTFDVAVAVHTLEHVKEAPALLRRLSAIARRIIVETPAERSDWLTQMLNDMRIDDLGDDTHYALYGRDSLKTLLEANGWHDVSAWEERGLVRALGRSEAAA